MDDVSVDIIIRPFDALKDEAFIYSTWRNQAYYSAVKKPDEDPKYFFQRQSRTIKSILQMAKVKIACMADAPTVIIGYVVYTNDHLNWIYVKEDYRKKGIGTMLWPREIKTVTCYLTKIGAVIADKKNLQFKENTNEPCH